MRLTLRTLLAWIDEVLAADEHRHLGEKVAASEVAPRLVDRITNVVSSPALAAPPPTGRGLADDPNTAAEFLDNVLEPVRLEGFERVCIESDAHLADVAGCHRILAEVVRDPACVEPLEPARLRAVLETARRKLRESTPAADGVRIDTAAPRPKDPAPVPPPRRRGPLAAWLSAAVAALLLVGLVGMLAWTLLPPRGDRRREAAETGAVAPRVEALEPAATVAAKAEPATQPDPVDPAEQADPAEPAEPRPPVAAADPGSQVVDPAPPLMATNEAQPRGEQPEPTAPAAPDVATPRPPTAEASPPAKATLPPERSVPFGDALALGGGVAPPAATVADASMVAAPSATAPAVQPPPEGGATLVSGAILVRPVEASDRWLAATARGPLAAAPGQIELLAPAWSYPVIAVGGVTVRLHPGSVATVSSGAGAPRLRLARGRAVVLGGGGTDLRLAVEAGGLAGMLTGPADRTVGIDVTAADRPPADPAAVSPLRAAVQPVGPATMWRQEAPDATGRPLIGIPLELLIPPAHALVWDGRDPAAAAVVAAAEPAWLEAVAPTDRTLRNAAAEIAAALATAPAAAALRGQLAATRPENRMAAAATLAFLGDHPPLADLLCEDSAAALHERQWLELLQATVPPILAHGGAEATALLAAIRQRAGAESGEEVVALIRGLDAVAPEATRGLRLVDDLESPSLAVRRLAIVRLRELVPDAIREGDDYRADRSATLRGDSVKWWRERITAATGGGAAPRANAVTPRPEPE